MNKFIEPLVSVLIPCYNHERFVEDCIQSVIKQDYQNIEILICDDCSSDKSVEIIDGLRVSLAERFTNVKILKNAFNQGVTKSLNRLLFLVKGEYIKIIASDDVLASNCIREFVNYFVFDSKLDIIVSNGGLIKETAKFPYYTEEIFYKNDPDLSKNNLFERLYSNNIIFAPGAIVRKSVYDRYGIYDENISMEDWEFWLRISKEGKSQFGYIDQKLVFYRQNENSVTSLYDNKKLELRREHVFQAELAIINKYGEYVSKELYARKKLNKILSERKIAKHYRLKQLYRVTIKEYKSFNMWNYIEFNKKFKCLFYKLEDKIWDLVNKE